MDFSIVIPVYNEAENVGSLLDEIRTALGSRVECEVVVVDDGSTDGTPEVLAEMRQDHPELRLLRHSVNRGQSAAILTGVRAARSEWIVTMDGDGQNNPADILDLLRTRDEHGHAGGSLLIAGNRAKRNDNLVRRCSSRVANSVRARLLKDGSPDTGCGLKLFKRDAFLSLPRFDHMHRFLPALFQRNDVNVITVEVDSRPRLHGHSKYGVFNRLWVGIVDLVGVIWLKNRPVDSDSYEVE